MKKFVLAFLTVVFLGMTVFAVVSIIRMTRFDGYVAEEVAVPALGRVEFRQESATAEFEFRLRMETSVGTGWTDYEYETARRELDEFFAPLGRNISVFYMNLHTGFTHVHNDDRVFFAASLSKSNHALYTFMLAEFGLADMYAVHTFTAADMWRGTGIMQFEPFGTQFTTRELLGLSVRESDNAAFRMLVRAFEGVRVSYADFAAEIGADSQMTGTVVTQNTHARDAGLWMYNIFNYIEGPGEFAHYFRYDLLNTAQTSHPYFIRGAGYRPVGNRVNVSMLQSDYPIARKYGWAGSAFHDAGIIYAPSPYILVILSNMDSGAHDLFAEISWFVQDFNSRKFEN